MPAQIHTTGHLDFQPAAPLHPSPLDWRDQFIYFLLVDRFDDNIAATPAYQPGVNNGLDAEQGHRFQGGNLKGITRRLDYIRELGCTTIWLSPILKNRIDKDDSYHGYGIQDFLQVDPRFGTLQDLKALTAAAHARGMYVVLDVVLNHAGDVWAYPDDNPYFYHQGQTFPFGFWREANPQPGFQDDDAVLPQELQHPEAFKRQGQIRNWSAQQESRDGDFLTLKELALPRPDVLDTLIKVYKYWISAADLDGFRVDTVKHMETSATAIFCNAMREYAQRVGKHNFFIFGEIVAGDDTIQRYLGRNSRIEGSQERFPSLDAALDFPLYFVLEDVIKGFSSPAVLHNRYETFRNHSAAPCEAGRYFVTFVDNHDQMARPYRRFMHNNPYPQQAVLAMTYLLCSQGIPCIYYGTEQGFDGGGDNDRYVRECMFGGQWGAFNSHGQHFFNPDNTIYQGIQAVAQVREQQAALRYGRQYFRETSQHGGHFSPAIQPGGVLAWSRILDTEEVLVVMNLDAQDNHRFVTVDSRLSAADGVMTDLLNPVDQYDIVDNNGRACVEISLPAHGLAILKCA